MATGSTLTVGKYGGTITVSVSSTPASNSRSYGSLPTYASRSGDVITLPVNTGNDRTFMLSVTATTNADPDYYGTASLNQTWLITQTGFLGPA